MAIALIIVFANASSLRHKSTATSSATSNIGEYVLYAHNLGVFMGIDEGHDGEEEFVFTTRKDQLSDSYYWNQGYH